MFIVDYHAATEGQDIVASLAYAAEYSISKLFSLGWPIIARKYVFSRRKAEKLRSAVAGVAGYISRNLVKRWT